MKTNDTGTKEKLAISYIRFSTPKQMEGDSLRRQTAATEDYCKRNGLTLTDSFRLKDLGKSGYKGDHRNPTAALGQLEKAVKEGRIPKGTVLIVENLDRLSREEVSIALELFIHLINRGLEIVALSDNERRYSKETVNSNPMDIMLSIMVLSRAHEESKIKAYRVKESWVARHKAISEGKHAAMRLPCWLESKNGSFQIIQDRAATIKQLFTLYLAGYGTLSIAGKMNEGKVALPSSQHSKRSGKWHSTHVARFLKWKEVTGVNTKVSPEVPNYFPTIISEKDFYAAQAKLKQNSNWKGQRTAAANPFGSIMTCAHCGQSIIKQYSNRHPYFACKGAKVKSCTCKHYVPYESFSKTLLTLLNTHGSFATDDAAAKEAKLEQDTLNGQLLEVTSKLEKATNLFLATPSEAGTKILQQLEANKKALEAKLEGLKGAKYLIDHRQDWKQVKALLEANINKAVFPDLQVIPLSVRIGKDQKPEFIRHETTESNDIALREAVRSIVSHISLDLKKLKATVIFQNKETLKVEFRENKGLYCKGIPRTYSYRLAGATEWN